MPQPYDEQTIETSLDNAVAVVLSQAMYHCPPDDGREDWDPEDFELTSQVARGSWPVRIPVEYELFFDGQGIQMQSRALTKPLPTGLRLDVIAAPQEEQGRASSPAQGGNHRRVFRALFPCDRQTLGNALVRSVHRDAKHGIPDLESLLMLALTQPESFLPEATHYFSDLLAVGMPDITGNDGLSALAVLLEVRAAGSLATLIERTTAADRTAGRRLRVAILDALADPWTCEHLGWLATGRLIEELEAN